MKTILVLLFCFSFHFSFAQSKIMDCMVQSNSGNSDLYVFLTDTLNVSGLNVKIGSLFDDGDLFNQQYSKATLPNEASLDYNTFFLPLGELNYSGAKYVWVKVMLIGGGYHEIKITAEN